MDHTMLHPGAVCVGAFPSRMEQAHPLVHKHNTPRPRHNRALHPSPTAQQGCDPCRPLSLLLSRRRGGLRPPREPRARGLDSSVWDRQAQGREQVTVWIAGEASRGGTGHAGIRGGVQHEGDSHTHTWHRGRELAVLVARGVDDGAFAVFLVLALFLKAWQARATGRGEGGRCGRERCSKLM
eukprot:678167-Pelagomonas_calceolata.AAC.10